MLTLESAMLLMMVKAMMPSTSSMMAAPKMALPERVFSLPSSFRVSTEMLTEVAVRITPMNMFCRNTGVVASDSMTPGWLKK